MIIYIITAGRIDYGERRLQLLQQDSYHINESPSFKMIQMFEAEEPTTPSLTYKITNDTTGEIFIAELRRETGQYKLKVMYDERRSLNSLVSPAEKLTTETPFAGVLTAATPSVEFTVENDEIKGSTLSHAAIVESLEKGSTSDVDYTDLNLSNQNFSGMQFKNLDLTGIDFTEANLQNSKFINCNLNNVTFRGAQMGNTTILNCNNIRGANFSDAQLHDAFLDNSQFDSTNMMHVNLSHTVIRCCGFKNANMADSNLQNTTLLATKLINTNLTRTTLTSARCHNVDMNSVILNNAKMRGIYISDSSVDNSDLSCADLSCDKHNPMADDLDTIALKEYAVFKQAMKNHATAGQTAAELKKLRADIALKTEFSGTTFSNTDLSGANFNNADLSYSHYTNNTRFIGTTLYHVAALSHSSFSDVDLSHQRFNNLNMTETMFRNVKLNGASLSGSNLTNASMSNLSMNGVCFDYATLTDAQLTNSSLIDSSFRHANLSNAEMSNTQLVSANMFDADLRSANLQGANMNGAILIDAKMNGTKLSNTTSMRETIDTKRRANEDFKEKHCRGIRIIDEADKYEAMATYADAARHREHERTDFYLYNSDSEFEQSFIDHANSFEKTTATPKSESQANATTQEKNIQVARPKSPEVINRPSIPFGDNAESLNAKTNLVEPTAGLSEMTREQPTSMGPNQLTQEIHQSETINPSVNIQNTSTLGQQNGTLSTQIEPKIGDDPILLGDNIKELLENEMDDEDAELIDAPIPENSKSEAPSIIPKHNYIIENDIYTTPGRYDGTAMGRVKFRVLFGISGLSVINRYSFGLRLLKDSWGRSLLYLFVSVVGTTPIFAIAEPPSFPLRSYEEEFLWGFTVQLRNGASSSRSSDAPALTRLRSAACMPSPAVHSLTPDSVFTPPT
ncbi:pentapeptide repeat-containing protein [Yersinia enterocolitica]|nr:pentapeptide repeat-containing protein [Yersinia enterocolitica]